MKNVAILLLLALALNGCGNNKSTSTTQAAASGLWQAQLLGGSGTASGFSFTTQFTVGSDGTLNITSFQFLTEGMCFPVDGGTQSGTMMLTVDSTTNAVTGTFSFTVQSGNNTLTLTGTVTGTEVSSTLSNTKVIGTWTLAGDAGCNDTTGGSFTMTQS